MFHEHPERLLDVFDQNGFGCVENVLRFMTC